MKFELIGLALCPFVHRSAIMLVEKNIAFDRRDIEAKDKPAWFLEISPRGKVPVLLADGQALFESAAINEFLDETHPPRLLPDDPFARARERAWVEVANDLFATQFAAFVATAADRPKATEKLEAVLTRFSEALANGTIAEDEFGLVHIAIAPALHRFTVVEDALGARFLDAWPPLVALARRVAARRSVVTTVASDFAPRFLALLAQHGSTLARAA